MKKLLLRSLSILTTSALLMPMAVSSAHAANRVDDPETVWIVGEQYQQESGFCFSKKLKQKRVKQELQVLDTGGTWVKLSSSSSYTKSSECPRKNPYSVTYFFIARQSGVLVDSEVSEYQLPAREYLNDGPEDIFIKTLYPTKQDHEKALLKAFMELLK